MDREKVTKPSAQVGFIKFVLIPLYEAVAAMFEEIRVSPNLVIVQLFVDIGQLARFSVFTLIDW